MIQYALKCEAGHAFESWFQSADAYDALAKAGHLSCAICGSTQVKKAIMAPRVAQGDAEAKEPASPPTLTAPGSEAEQALAEFRRKVETQSDYVGTKFADEARAMHQGDAPERSIYGEARMDEAKKLVEEGVPLMPLPFTPKKKLS